MPTQSFKSKSIFKFILHLRLFTLVIIALFPRVIAYAEGVGAEHACFESASLKRANYACTAKQNLIEEYQYYIKKLDKKIPSIKSAEKICAKICQRKDTCQKPDSSGQCSLVSCNKSCNPAELNKIITYQLNPFLNYIETFQDNCNQSLTNPAASECEKEEAKGYCDNLAYNSSVGDLVSASGNEKKISLTALTKKINKVNQIFKVVKRTYEKRIEDLGLELNILNRDAEYLSNQCKKDDVCDIGLSGFVNKQYPSDYDSDPFSRYTNDFHRLVINTDLRNFSNTVLDYTLEVLECQNKETTPTPSPTVTPVVINPCEEYDPSKHGEFIANDATYSFAPIYKECPGKCGHSSYPSALTSNGFCCKYPLPQFGVASFCDKKS